ncbi:unnamed protein product [Cyprideis torosa]|uniref:Seipin n=1 Tax=Cyprideis torosa TaxID=163714 RepID=A0A7R8WUP7_9CRUS|nr:unnamed protein product [Cyprideis torosa]CAG0906971.1 unnamed protein product [Cyprideis torosa]
MFYYLYMPAMTHSRPVHFAYPACENVALPCGFPNANVTLIRRVEDRFLMRGQSYHFVLDLELPDSPTNHDAGMFMVKMKLLDPLGGVIREGTRSTVMRYSSPMVYFIRTIVLGPLLAIGYVEEKQILSIEVISHFEDDPRRPVVGAAVEIQSRFLRIYSGTLRIHAQFSGLRYVMHNFPMLSAVGGIITNLFFLFMLSAFAWTQLVIEPYNQNTVYVTEVNTGRKSLNARREEMVKKLEEKDRRAFLNRSYSLGQFPLSGPSLAPRIPSSPSNPSILEDSEQSRIEELNNEESEDGITTEASGSDFGTVPGIRRRVSFSN